MLSALHIFSFSINHPQREVGLKSHFTNKKNWSTVKLDNMLKVTKLGGDKAGVVPSSKSSLWLALPQLLPSHMTSLCRRVIPTNTYLQHDLSLSIGTTFFYWVHRSDTARNLACIQGNSKQKRCRLCPPWACNLRVDTNVTHCNEILMEKVQGMAGWHGKATYQTYQTWGSRRTSTEISKSWSRKKGRPFLSDMRRRKCMVAKGGANTKAEC